MQHDVGLKSRRVGIARYYHLEPGDGTRYEFMVMRRDEEYLYCAEVHGLTFQGYPFRETSVIDCWRELKQGETVSASKPEFGPHPYIGYVSDRAHANCNPWTARAAVFAMWLFLQDEKRGAHEYIT